MASQVPPLKNSAAGWTGYVSLGSRSTTGVWQANPTLAAGDVQISLDGGALNNLATLPVVSPAGSKLVKIVLNQAETNADNIIIVFSDVAGDEWNNLTIDLQTVAYNFDSIPALIAAALATYDAPTHAEMTAELALADDAVLAALSTISGTLATIVSYIDTEVAAIYSRLGAPAGASLAADLVSLSTLIDNLPTNAELATALAGADDAALAQIALVKAKTDLISAAPVVAGGAVSLTAFERNRIRNVPVSKDWRTSRRRHPT